MKKLYQRWCIKNAIKYCCAIMILVIVSLNTTNVDAKTYNVNYTKTISSYEGKSIQLKWKGKSSKVKWYSSDGFVAVVNQSGKVKLKNAGKVWIKAVYKGKSVKRKIIVKKPYISSEKETLDVGETVICKLNGGKAVRWESSNLESATVDGNGVVTAHKTGTSIISANVENGRKYDFEIKVYNSQTLQGLLNNKRLVSHRGYNAIAPENTMSAFQKAYEYGYKYVETDVTFTADGVPVLLHDDSIGRTSNGSGKIASLTYEYVRTLDFGSWKSKEYAGEKIPSFDEFMAFCSTHDIHPYVELKSNITQARVYELMDIVDKYNMRDKTSWVSFNITYLQYMKNADPKAELGLNTFDVNDNTYNLIQKLKTSENTLFLSINTSCLNSELIQKCKLQNIPIGVWICDTRDEVFQLDPYISTVTTNKVLLD